MQNKKGNKKKLNLDVLKVESFTLGETKNVKGGAASGGGRGERGDSYETADSGCPTFDTTSSCCIQNDNS